MDYAEFGMDSGTLQRQESWLGYLFSFLVKLSQLTDFVTRWFHKRRQGGGFLLGIQTKCLEESCPFSSNSRTVEIRDHHQRPTTRPLDHSGLENRVDVSR